MWDRLFYSQLYIGKLLTQIWQNELFVPIFILSQGFKVIIWSILGLCIFGLTHPYSSPLSALQYHRPVSSHREVDESQPTIEMTFILIVVDCSARKHSTSLQQRKFRINNEINHRVMHISHQSNPLENIVKVKNYHIPILSKIGENHPHVWSCCALHQIFV